MMRVKLPQRLHLQPVSCYSTSSFSSLAEQICQKPTQSLTQHELNKINLLLPRLCLANNNNHLHTATNLTVAALLTNPPSNSISFSFLIHSLTSLPDLTLSKSLLNRLKHSPPTHPHLTPITTKLIASFLKKGRPMEALKVYNWMIRSGFPCKVEPVVFGVLVNGFCEKELLLEALKVLKDMTELGFAPNPKLRERVFRSLLREARIREAQQLNEGLRDCVEDGGGEGLKKVIVLLDQIIANWTE
ncbi:pentatricopeptide repeat-containing protein At1g06580-like [Tripterygium wilfordii]|uniref:pentatricopeptide repeat-containing protein At1g06580-like n=1 Tax=Tripterygium wilfordii TaxID=458696 RepID=UPI0018F83989|nr:pentatricopeptide repeat-containing protein At1g06580-like [Tripterygium wilfordii]